MGNKVLRGGGCRGSDVELSLSSMNCGGFSGSRSRNVLLEVCEMCEQWRLHFALVDLDTRCRCHMYREYPNPQFLF